MLGFVRMKNFTRAPIHSAIVARSRASLVAAVAVALIASALVTPALATSYKGWGDTGWNFYDKRDCCEEAVWLAQEDSMIQCENAGGAPKVRSGSTRGLCDWDARGGTADRIYRCTATADVYCR